MHIPSRIRTVFCSIVPLLSLILLPHAASAASFSGNASYDMPGVEVCGIDTTLSISGTIVYNIHKEPTGIGDVVVGRISTSFDVTFTSSETGIATTTGSYRTSDQIGAMWLGDGFYQLSYPIDTTLIVIVEGSQFHIRDVGRIVLFDQVYLGDPRSATDNFFVSSTLGGLVDGPPTENDGSDFCTQFIAYMGG